MLGRAVSRHQATLGHSWQLRILWPHLPNIEHPQAFLPEDRRRSAFREEKGEMESCVHMGSRNQPKEQNSSIPSPPDLLPGLPHLLGPPLAHQFLHQDTPSDPLYKSGILALTTPQARS